MGTDTITVQQLEKSHNYDPDLVKKLANLGILRPSTLTLKRIQITGFTKIYDHS